MRWIENSRIHFRKFLNISNLMEENQMSVIIAEISLKLVQPLYFPDQIKVLSKNLLRYYLPFSFHFFLGELYVFLINLNYHLNTKFDVFIFLSP